MKKKILIFLTVILVILVFVSVLHNISVSHEKVISVNDFYDGIIRKEFESIRLYGEKAYITTKTGATAVANIPYIGYFLNSILQNKIPLKLESGGPLITTFLNKMVGFIASIAEIGLMIFLLNNMNSGLMNSRKKESTENGKRPTIRFKDVIGMKNEKREMRELLEMSSKQKEVFTKYGCRPLNGMLLCGPPGNGKTFLVKALAGETNCAFFSTSGASFVEMFVGVGAARVRALFEEAKKKAPSIIFIDEADAIGTRSSGGDRWGGQSERDNTINELLVQMDGMDTSTNVLVILATNLRRNIDPAILRPGRIDREIYIGNPYLEDRIEMLKHFFRRSNIPFYVEPEIVARRLAGFSRAEVENTVNEMKMLALRGKTLNDEIFVDYTHIELALDRKMLGLEKDPKIMDLEETERTAYHEAGHAYLMYHFQKKGAHEGIYKLTILPRGGALGFAAQNITKDRVSQRRDEYLAQICIGLAGRLAEELFFGLTKVTTGCSSDLESVRTLAEIYVRHGMSEKFGLSFYNSDGWSASGHEKDEIVKHVHELVEACEKQTRQILFEAKEKIEKATRFLLKVGTLTGEDFAAIVEGRGFLPMIISYKKSIQ